MQQNQRVFQTPIRDKGKKSATNPMSRRDRLFRVQVGIAAGRSNRRLAKELGVDEGTIRRDRLTLLLSKEEVQAVRAGAAVEPLLRKQERRKAATAREKHEAAERDSQFLTNRLIKLIVNWLNEFSLILPDMLHIIMGVDRWSWEHGTRMTAYIPDAKIRATIEATKPKADDHLEVFALIEFLKEWLFRWMVIVEPDRDVRDRALTKIRQELERQSPVC